jgi:hypothetical protein
MPSFVPLGPRARVVAALLAAAACIATGVAAVGACLTAPPSDIGTSTNERPLIVHTSVQPPEGLLAGWPSDDQFYVPVQLPDPSATCFWRVFDQDLEVSSQAPGTFVEGRPCATTVIDGGVVLQDVALNPPVDPGHCHIFTFIVAHNFSSNSLSSPDSIGGDALTWDYYPPGALCNFYDAGAFQDGAFPSDGASDAPLVTPESGPLGDGGSE